MTSNFIIEIVFPAHSLCVVFFPPTLLLVLSIHPSITYLDPGVYFQKEDLLYPSFYSWQLSSDRPERKCRPEKVYMSTAILYFDTSL